MKTVFMVSIILSTGFLSAQENEENARRMLVNLFAGVSLPQGDFGSTSSQKASFAQTGFSAMLEGSKPLDKSLNWTSSLSLSVNSVNETEMQNQVQRVFGSGVTVTAGSFITTWAMTGLKAESPTSSTGSVYAVGQIGILFSSFPDITLSGSGNSVTQTTTSSPAFAYGIGAGFQTEKINVGLRYFAGEPEYEESASGGGSSSSLKVKMPVAVLQFILGINL